MMKGLRFLKLMVVFSIGFIVAFTITSMILNYKLGLELSPTLTTSVYGFFGTELAASALIKIIENWKEKNKEKGEE